MNMSNEEKLKLYAVICASLDVLSEIDNQIVNMAFTYAWNEAMELEGPVLFYRRIDKAKAVLGFPKE